MPGYWDSRYFSTKIILQILLLFPPFGTLKFFGRHKYLSIKVPKLVTFFPTHQPHLSPTFVQSTEAYGIYSLESYFETGQS